MKTQADKTALNKSKAVANTSSDKQDKRESEAQFKDNRTEVVAQRKFRAMAENSLQAGKIAQLHAIANRSSPEPVQKQGVEEEEELLQGKFETIQKQGLEEEETQAKSAIVQKKEERPTNNTGLPDTLKSGIENLSGLSLDDVKVYYNSQKPAQLQAHAFAQGTDIHMAPGQEKHLPHEAWHVVQQKQGRVKPTMQLKGKVNVNDDVGLEKEADVMGARAAQVKGGIHNSTSDRIPLDATGGVTGAPSIQRKIGAKLVKGVIKAQKDGKRPPGPLSGGGQGDHLAAYVLYEMALVNAINGQTLEEAWESLVLTHKGYRDLPGYSAGMPAWARDQSENIYATNAEVDATTVTANHIETYANDLLTIRNKMGLTSVKTTGGSTGGHGEGKHAGGLQWHERQLQLGNEPTADKDDVLFSMARLIDHTRFSQLPESKRDPATSQAAASMMDAVPQLVDYYDITQDAVKMELEDTME